MRSQTQAKQLIELLTQKGQTLAVAESLTGGMLSSALCDISGASKVFLEGVVTYSKDSKIFRLGVDPETLASYSPVSEQVACQMASGVRKALNADHSISTTGVAGPGADEDGNPEGLFYIGIASADQVRSFRFQESGTRSEIREKAVCYAIDKLYELLSDPKDR